MKSKLKFFFIDRTDDTKIQLFRSIQSSQFSYLVDLGFYMFMVEILFFPYLLSRLISYMIGTTVSYLLSVHWIFPTRTVENRWMEYGSFAGIGLLGAGANLLLMALFMEKLGFYHLYANIIAGLIVFILSFTLRKILLFTKRQKV